MAPYADSDGDGSDGEYEDDASLCDFLESEVMGDQEADDVDAAPETDAQAVGLNGEDAIAATQVFVEFRILLRVHRYFYQYFSYSQVKNYYDVS